MPQTFSISSVLQKIPHSVLSHNSNMADVHAIDSTLDSKLLALKREQAALSSVQKWALQQQVPAAARADLVAKAAQRAATLKALLAAPDPTVQLASLVSAQQDYPRLLASYVAPLLEDHTAVTSTLDQSAFTQPRSASTAAAATAAAAPSRRAGPSPLAFSSATPQSAAPSTYSTHRPTTPNRHMSTLQSLHSTSIPERGAVKASTMRSPAARRMSAVVATGQRGY